MSDGPAPSSNSSRTPPSSLSSSSPSGSSSTPASAPVVGPSGGTLDGLAWTALLARWVEVARASRAIPAADARLRDSIPPLIAIEATTAALGELTRLVEADRPHARALAELSIQRAAGELDRIWRGVEWPDELHVACDAAARALRLALYAGLEELVVAHDGPDAAEPFVVPDLGLGFDPDAPDSHAGTLAAMPPGSLAMPGEPIAWWCTRPAPLSAQVASAGGTRLIRRPAALPRQVYRGLDEHGRFTEDLVACIESDVAAGLPMLVPLVVDGHPVGRFLRAGDEWLAMQRRALGGRAAIPVRHATDRGPAAT